MDVNKLLEVVIAAIDAAKDELGITDVRPSYEFDGGFVVETTDSLIEFCSETYHF